MFRYLSITAFIFYFFLHTCMAQLLTHTGDIGAEKSDYEQIKVVPLSNDSLSSSFVIFVKEGVPLHKHEHHTEYVYVLEGSGSMRLDSAIISISAGDLIHIPRNTAHDVHQVTSDKALKVISIQTPYFDGSDRVLLNAIDKQ